MTIDLEARARKRLHTPIDLNALPKAEACVAIAKDVLAALDLKKLHATSGTYFFMPDKARRYKTSLRDEVATKVCEVCALGALFVADIARRNKFDLINGMLPTRVEDGRAMRKRLGAFFDQHQLELIECAFEGLRHAPSGDGGANTLARKAAADFCDGEEDDEKRMRSIMNNIIGNKGTFCP